MVESVKWPARLVVVRHGQSEFNIAKDLAKVSDDPTEVNRFLDVRDMDVGLTKEGLRQAAETGKHLAGTPRFDIVFSSPYKRCLQTANGIVEQFPYKASIYRDNRIREKEFGWLHGLTKSQIAQKFPDEFRAYKRDGKYWYRSPGGENYPDVEQRVHMFLDKLHRDYAGKHVLVVTHSVTALLFRALFEHLAEEEVLGLDKTEDMKNCGITTFLIDTAERAEGRLKLHEYNHAVY